MEALSADCSQEKTSMFTVSNKFWNNKMGSFSFKKGARKFKAKTKKNIYKENA